MVVEMVVMYGLEMVVMHENMVQQKFLQNQVFKARGYLLRSSANTMQKILDPMPRWQ